MKRPFSLAVSAAVVAALALGCASESDNSAQASDRRTVKIDMVDNKFKPNEVGVRKGDTVRFVFDNKGKVDHDAVIGDRAAQAEHEQEMRALESQGHGAEHGAEHEGAITVGPGEAGELTSTFDRAGTTEIGCHEVGHYAAGMKVTVEVT